MICLEKDDKYVIKYKNSCFVGGDFYPIIRYIFYLFRNKPDDYLYLYIKNL